jgi:hypothetical protein
MFVTDVWNEDWRNQTAVKVRFDREKRRHVASIVKAAGGSTPGLRVFEIG